MSRQAIADEIRQLPMAIEELFDGVRMIVLWGGVMYSDYDSRFGDLDVLVVLDSAPPPGTAARIGTLRERSSGQVVVDAFVSDAASLALDPPRVVTANGEHVLNEVNCHQLSTSFELLKGEPEEWRSLFPPVELQAAIDAVTPRMLERLEEVRFLLATEPATAVLDRHLTSLIVFMRAIAGRRQTLLPSKRAAMDAMRGLHPDHVAVVDAIEARYMKQALDEIEGGALSAFLDMVGRELEGGGG